MASGTERGVEAAGGPAVCYRELSRFPAITRAALGAAAEGQTFLLYTGSSARTHPRGSTAQCSAAAHSRATSCWRCGAAAGAATVWTSRRWGSTGQSTQRGPLPVWPGPAQRRGCSTWPRRTGPNHGPPAPGMCQEQPGQWRRTKMRRVSSSCTARTGGRH